jgi:hypothetical protein
VSTAGATPPRGVVTCRDALSVCVLSCGVFSLSFPLGFVCRSSSSACPLLLLCAALLSHSAAPLQSCTHHTTHEVKAQCTRSNALEYVRWWCPSAGRLRPPAFLCCQLPRALRGGALPRAGRVACSPPSLSRPSVRYLTR